MPLYTDTPTDDRDPIPPPDVQTPAEWLAWWMSREADDAAD